MFPLLIPVDEGSRIAEVRRLMQRAAQEEGLDEHAMSGAAIVGLEAATNLLKHASGGAAYISKLSPLGAPGVEIIAYDRGPGITDIPRSVVDGYSTVQTTGTGLGAIARIASVFDIYSEPGKGTVLVARVFGKKSSRPDLPIGAMCVPIRGEEACGDSWYARQNGHSATLMMADGLGHGVMAAEASSKAVVAFARSPAASPLESIDRLHRALRGTRGAAIAIAEMDLEERAVRFSGLGNIAGVIIGGEKPQFMVSHNGTAGHQAQRVQQFEYRLPRTGVLILHSDGLNTSWNLDAYPGLLTRHPSIIAAVLYRDANRGRDDACVLAARIPGA